jgi:SPP1 gp7 family putative phage head morphogenesis protein
MTYKNEIQKAMQSLEASLIGLDDPVDILRAFQMFAASKAFSTVAETTAMKMVTHLFSDAGKTWRQAAFKNSSGRKIYEALRKEMRGPIGNAVRHQININAEMIKSLPIKISREVSQHILTQSLRGTRSSDIAEQIKRFFPEKSEANAKLIARTETSKASSALTRVRSEDMGIDWYVWRTSEDSRVRSSHKIMEGVLVRWRNPPSPETLDGEKSFGHYNCGDIFNCRCYAEPVIDLDFVSWPAKVYYGGSIQRMTRKQFEEVA